MYGKLLYAAAVVGLLSLTGCSRGPSATLNVTDAPVDSLYEVWITFTGAIFHAADGAETYVDVDPAKAIELTHLSGGGAEVILDQTPLPAGDYEWFRVLVDLDRSYVVEEENGGQLPLQCPSCTADESGLKFNRPFTIPQTGVAEFTLDFDLRKSITHNAKGYKLRPTVRVVDANTVLIQITGTVTDATTHSDFLLALDSGECAVYVYEGTADTVEPDDIFLDGDGVEQHPSSPVVTTADVVYNAESSAYEYAAAFLPADVAYTVALTCDPDDPAAEDAVTFHGETTVPVGGEPTVDFVLTDPAP